MAGSSNSHIINYDDRAARSRYEALAFDEAAAFRLQMKGVEEQATSGAVTQGTYEGGGRRNYAAPRVAGQRVRVAHRLGDRFAVQVQDPFTRRMRTVVVHQYDLRGNRVRTDVAWQPGNPESVAAVFGIPFVSAFGELEGPKTQEEADRDRYRKAIHDSYMEHMMKKAKARGYQDFVDREYGHVENETDVPPEHREAWKVSRKKRRGSR